MQVHRRMLPAWQQLCAAAEANGFKLQMVSAYRSFSRQLTIWNDKAAGRRPLLDDTGKALDVKLDEARLLAAIMRWSAVPGLSRHHWGSDVDVFDAAQMPIEQVQLIPAEVEGDGPCAALHEWLTEQIANNCSFGFFRPYQFDCGGIAPELWHLSYLPVAVQMERQLSVEVMLDIWRQHDVALLQPLVQQLEKIWPLYVQLDYSCQPQWVVDALQT